MYFNANLCHNQNFYFSYSMSVANFMYAPSVENSSLQGFMCGEIH